MLVLNFSMDSGCFAWQHSHDHFAVGSNERCCNPLQKKCIVWREQLEYYCTCDIMRQLFRKQEWQAVGVQLGSHCHMWVIQHFTPLSLTPVIITVAGQGEEEKLWSWKEQRRKKGKDLASVGFQVWHALYHWNFLWPQVHTLTITRLHQKSHRGLETSMWFGFTVLTRISDPKLTITRAIMET